MEVKKQMKLERKYKTWIVLGIAALFILYGLFDWQFKFNVSEEVVKNISMVLFVIAFWLFFSGRKPNQNTHDETITNNQLQDTTDETEINDQLPDTTDKIEIAGSTPDTNGKTEMDASTQDTHASLEANDKEQKSNADNGSLTQVEPDDQKK